MSMFTRGYHSDLYEVDLVTGYETSGGIATYVYLEAGTRSRREVGPFLQQDTSELSRAGHDELGAKRRKLLHNPHIDSDDKRKDRRPINAVALAMRVSASLSSQRKFLVPMVFLH